jgi:hypothetical protein
MDYRSTTNIGNLDPRITFELTRDFRLHKPKLDLPLQFKEWMQWREDNKGVLEIIEWATTILNEKDGISINSMVRIMQKFSGVSTKIQRQAIITLIGDCKFVRADIKFKSSSDLVIDFDNSLLFNRLQDTKLENIHTGSVCYS